MSMDKLFYADPGKEQQFSYRFLNSLLGAETLEYSPYCHSADTFDVFRSLLTSLILDRELTLLDADFSAAELQTLLVDSTIVKQRNKLPNPCANLSLDDLIEKIEAVQNWRLNLFTSGTTGTPKKVAHSFQSISRAVRTGDKFANNCWGFAYNPTHIAGVQVFLQAFLNRNSLINVFGLSRPQILDAIENYQVSHLSATPTYYRLLLPFEKPYDSVIRVTSGGEKLDNQLLVRLKSLFPNARFLNVYASTEAGTIFAAEGDIFTLKEHYADLVRIEDNEILLHQALLGESKALVLQNGWYHTNDIVQVLSQEPLRFKFVHRKNEMINVGGYKVNPNEVEEVIRTHPKVSDVRVYGIHNSVTGSMLECDIVCLDSALTVRDLREFMQPHLQGYKIPRLINFVNSLDLTSTGKVRRS